MLKLFNLKDLNKDKTVVEKQRKFTSCIKRIEGRDDHYRNWGFWDGGGWENLEKNGKNRPLHVGFLNWTVSYLSCQGLLMPELYSMSFFSHCWRPYDCL